MASLCAVARVAALCALASLQQAACLSAQMRSLSAWRIPAGKTAFAAALLPRTDVVFSPVPQAGRSSRRAARCAMMQGDPVADDTAQAILHIARGVGSSQHLRRPQVQGITSNKTNYSVLSRAVARDAMVDPGALVFFDSSALWTQDQKVTNVVRITQKLEYLHNLIKTARDAKERAEVLAEFQLLVKPAPPPPGGVRGPGGGGR